MQHLLCVFKGGPGAVTTLVAPKNFVSRAWNKGVAPFREFGLALGIVYGLHRALNRLGSGFGVYPYQFFMQAVGHEPLLPPALAKNIRAEALDPGHALLGIVQAPEAVLADRFASRAKGMVVLRNDEPLGYVWWCEGSYRESEVRCVFVLSAPETAVFDFDVYVLPAYRMGLGFVSVWHLFMERLRSEGITHSYSRISMFNLASRRAHLRLGGQVIGSSVFVRLGPLTLALTRRLPYIRAALGSACKLRMCLSRHGVEG